MRYLVTGHVKPGKSSKLLKAIENRTLGKGSIAGGEYVRNMKQARLLENTAVRWVEVCFCPTPLMEEIPYWEEYFNLTELASVTSGVVHGEADEEMVPSLVSLNDIGEAYEGCLLRVEAVTVTNSDLGYGEWEIGDGTATVRCDDKWDYFYYPTEGHELADIEGVLDYNYSNYKLQPRLARDVVEAVSYTHLTLPTIYSV